MFRDKLPESVSQNNLAFQIISSFQAFFDSCGKKLCDALYITYSAFGGTFLDEYISKLELFGFLPIGQDLTA